MNVASVQLERLSKFSGVWYHWFSGNFMRLYTHTFSYSCLEGRGLRSVPLSHKINFLITNLSIVLRNSEFQTLNSSISGEKKY